MVHSHITTLCVVECITRLVLSPPCVVCALVVREVLAVTLCSSEFECAYAPDCSVPIIFFHGQM